MDSKSPDVLVEYRNGVPVELTADEAAAVLAERAATAAAGEKAAAEPKPLDQVGQLAALLVARGVIGADDAVAVTGADPASLDAKAAEITATVEVTPAPEPPVPVLPG